MPYVPIPRDIANVKTKVALGFTLRQLVCLGIAGVLGLPVYWYTKDYLGTKPSLYLMLVLISPFLIAAFILKNGMPYEQYLLLLIKWRFIRPRTRSYQTDNLYDRINKQIAIDKEFNKYANFNKTKKLNKKNSKRNAAFKDRPKKRINIGAKKKNNNTDKKIKENGANSEIDTTDNSL